MSRKTTLSNVDRPWAGISSVIIAIIWVVGFSIWFFQFELPNNLIPRSMLLMRIPFDLLDVVDPPIQPGAPSWSWLYLLQRLPFFSIAVVIWIGAWAQGSLVLRLVKVPLQGSERLFFALCAGMSTLSLTMLGLGLCGAMSRWWLAAVIATSFVTELLLIFLRDRPASIVIESPVRTSDKREGTRPATGEHKNGRPRLSRLGLVTLVVLTPIVAGLFLGAMSPQTDFDVVEYHLGGPKEWFQQGYIARLPHNIYTSFPFLSEMLILSGMVLSGDWQWGALAGQAATAGFAPLTALGLFAASRRWFSEPAGWMAALVYLTSPWTYRISIIAYAEGSLACYLFASLYGVLLFRDLMTEGGPDLVRQSLPCAMLTGLMAGSGMACKYTGLYAVVVPAAMLLVLFAMQQRGAGAVRQTILALICFTIGVVTAVGPWLLKNTIETGNPVYPLAVRVFGGIDRDEMIDAKFVRGHAPVKYKTWTDRLSDLPVKLTDVISKNDWHSPLMFALAPLSLFWLVRRSQLNTRETPDRKSRQVIVEIIWLMVAWQFFTWWILTHHIDRFYVPMFSVVAMLAGIGACWWKSEPTMPGTRSADAWKGVAASVVGLSILYNVELMIQQGITGFNAGRLDLKAAEEIAVEPRIKWLNNEYETGRLPPRTRVLCVGEVLLFHSRFPYLYNTVFDHSIFERICSEPNSAQYGLRSAAEIRAEFKRLGITLIDVNWGMILQYRDYGNYGFTDFVDPPRFEELQRLGVLGPALNIPPSLSFAPLDDALRARLEEWGPGLITSWEGQPAYIKAQIFPVIQE